MMHVVLDTNIVVSALLRTAGLPAAVLSLALDRVEVSILVTPSFRAKACTDPDDDIFLECAEAAEANYLVTGQ